MTSQGKKNPVTYDLEYLQARKLCEKLNVITFPIVKPVAKFELAVKSQGPDLYTV